MAAHGSATPTVSRPRRASIPTRRALREIAFEQAPTRAGRRRPRAGRLVARNTRPARCSGSAQRDSARPLQDLELSLPPARAALADRPGPRRTARALERPRASSGATGNDAAPLDVQLAPAARAVGDASPASSIAFTDVTALPRARRTRSSAARRELETAYEELQSTIEELETTNEELQSTNEELETTNEELQSTNEELETMNEELQSTNEELETMNDELRERTDEAEQANAFLESILGEHPAGRGRRRPASCASTRGTARAAELWGLRADEVQRRAPAEPRHRDPGRPAARAAARGRSPVRRKPMPSAGTQSPRAGGGGCDLVRSAHRAARGRAGRDSRDGRRARRAGLRRRLMPRRGGCVPRAAPPARARASPSRGAPRCAPADRRRAIAAASPSRW